MNDCWEINLVEVEWMVWKERSTDVDAKLGFRGFPPAR